MQLDEKAINFIREAKQSGYTIDQVASFLRDKGYDFEYNNQPSKESQAEQPIVESPGVIEGFGRSVSTGVLGGFKPGEGLAPLLAGVTNIGASHFGGVVGAIADLDPAQLRALDPRKIPEQFSQGKEEYIRSQQAFEQEHPIASTIGKGVGTVGGIALTGGTVGAATKAKVGATALGKIPQIGNIASRTAGEMAAFGTYEAARGATKEGELSGKGALYGALEGIAMGGAFGSLGGGLEVAEKSLVKTAENLIANPSSNVLLNKLAQATVEHPIAALRTAQAAGVVAEGATIGALPAIIAPEGERHIPTLGEIGTGVGLVAGGRVVAKGASELGKKAYEFANKPTKMQVQEMRARAQQIEQAQEKADTALAKEIEATKETEELKRQGASSRAIKEAQVAEDWESAYRKEAEQELEDVLANKIATKEVDITVKPEEVDEYMKAHSKNKYMTREKAERHILREKQSAVAQLTPTQKLPLKERIVRGAKELTSKTIQQFNWLRPVEEGVLNAEAVTGQKVAPSKNPVFTANKLRNRGEQEALINPVMETVESVEKEYPGSVEGAREYLEAQKKIQFTKAEGNVPDKSLTEIVEQYKDDEPVQRIVKQVRELNTKALDSLYESGRIDKTMYERLKQNDSYVPSWLEKYDDAGEQIVMNHSESYLKKYTGSGDLYQNPILTSMEQAKRIYQFSELQKIKKQYIDLAKKTGQAVKFKAEGEYKGGPVKFDKKDQIVLWENGQPQIWNVPQRVADYFNPVPIPKDGKIENFLKWVGKMPLRAFKGATTAASLGFAESNIPRDVSGALFGSEYGGNISASMLASSTKELINREPIVGALRKQIGQQTMRDVEQLPGLSEDNVKRFVDMYSSIDKSTKSNSPQNVIAKLFTVALPNYAKKAGKFLGSTNRKVLETLSYTGNLSEETTRLSVFKSVLQGMAKDEREYQLWLRKPDLIPQDVLAKAGNEAREVTLNFNRQMAPWVETANRYFLPYFKPAILGAMRGMNILSNPTIAPRAWRYIINLGILQGLIKGKIVDGQQLEDLDAINNEISGKSLILRGDNKRLYTIPLGQELAPLVNMFAGATEKMYRGATKQQRQDIGREMLTAGRQMFSNYAPVIGYLDTPSNFAIGGPIPKTILEEWTNKDFYTRTPIVPKSQEGKVAYMQQTKSTPALAISISRQLGRYGINISPLRIRHISTGLFSNVAKEFFAASDSVMSEFGAGPLRAKKGITDSPYTRRLIADISAPYNQYSQDANEIIDKATKGFKAIEEGQDGDWTPSQQREYEMQDEIYYSIKPDIDGLRKLYKQRAQEEKAFAEDAMYLREQYKKGEIKKADYLKQWSELESELKEFEENQTLEERALQLSIIEIEREIKDTYKKSKNNPR